MDQDRRGISPQEPGNPSNQWSGPGGPEKEPPRRPRLIERRWSVWVPSADHLHEPTRAGAYVIAAFPTTQDRLLARLVICVGEPRPAPCGMYPPAIGEGGVPREQLEEAFRAMAAAPELLAACKAQVQWFDELQAISDPSDPLVEVRNRTHGRRIDALRAAIAKAGGAA